MKANSVETTCAHCGKTIMVHPYRLKNGTGKYCNKVCYFAHRWPATGVCKECGKPSKTRFCTPKCQRDYWNKNDRPIHRKREWERKIAIMDSLGGKCTQCGITDYRCLDIHHIDPSLKNRPTDGIYIMSRRLKDWDKNKGNLELLCANCHRIHTWEQRGYGIGSALIAEI